MSTKRCFPRVQLLCRRSRVVQLNHPGKKSAVPFARMAKSTAWRKLSAETSTRSGNGARCPSVSGLNHCPFRTPILPALPSQSKVQSLTMPWSGRHSRGSSMRLLNLSLGTDDACSAVDSRSFCINDESAASIAMLNSVGAATACCLGAGPSASVNTASTSAVRPNMIANTVSPTCTELRPI